MNKILILVLLACALGLAPFSATAQSAAKKKSAKTSSKAGSTKSAETKKPETGDVVTEPASPEVKIIATPKPDDKKTDDKKPDAAASGTFNFAGADFDLMKALSIESDPKGMTILTGSVRIESADLNISCDLLKMDNNTHIMIATGNPVQLDKRQGGVMQAHCRNLTYHTDTKSALLENEAVVVQTDEKGQKKQASADVIKIDYPPAEPGKDNSNAQPKVSLMNRTGQPVEIRNLNGQGKSNTAAKPAGATKVTKNNLEEIKVPKSPGVE